MSEATHANARSCKCCRAVMVRLVAEGRSAREVAAMFDLSPQTVYKRLRRRRHEEGGEGQARYARARELIMAHQDVSLTKIAFEVGYGDLAAFSRAFRRWCGEPPVQIRRSSLPPSPVSQDA